MKNLVENVPAQSEKLVETVERCRLMTEMIQSQMLINHEQNAAYFCLQDEIVNGNFNAGRVEFF
jgi:hypothetical protein